jgi:hypothetical protein
MHQLKEKGILKVAENQERIPTPMTSIAEFGAMVQKLLTDTADELAKKRGLYNGNGK